MSIAVAGRLLWRIRPNLGRLVCCQTAPSTSSRLVSACATRMASSRGAAKQQPVKPPKQQAPTLKSSMNALKKRTPNASESDRVLFDPPKGIAKQNYHYFLVLDFEATCQPNDMGPIMPVQEIIEFPVMKVNAKTFEIESTFHTYVSPKHNQQLKPFCTQLTGIIQSMVDGQPQLPEVLSSFHKWLIAENLSINDEEEGSKRWIFITCGDWDLKTCLKTEADSLKIDLPEYFTRWINIKFAFAEAFNRFPNSMMIMLRLLNIQHTGRHHSGIDDVRNISAVVKGMAENSGYVFHQTWFDAREQMLTETKLPMEGLSR